MLPYGFEFNSLDPTGATYEVWFVVNLFAGDAIENVSIFALALIPYSMATAVSSVLRRAVGPKNQSIFEVLQRYLTLLFSLGLSISFCNRLLDIQEVQNLQITVLPSFFFYIVTITSTVGGAQIVAWLSNQIDTRGIGLGEEVISASGILLTITSNLDYYKNILGQYPLIINLVVIGGCALMLTGLLLNLYLGKRRVPLLTDKRAKSFYVIHVYDSNKPLLYGLLSVLLIRRIIELIYDFTALPLLYDLLSPQRMFFWLFAAYCSGLFTFVLRAQSVDIRKDAEEFRIKEWFVPGIRPGKQTFKYLDGIWTQVCLVAAGANLLLTMVPYFVAQLFELPLFFSLSLFYGSVLLISFLLETPVFRHYMSSEKVEQEFSL